MPSLNFSVDSALLRELGERLVGRPHIALAELVKNGYDADASRVTIRFLPEENCIKIHDDGHGMTLEEFRDFWMRVGTTHKSRKRLSKYLNRLMTGSKGVGRLSVQFLAKRLRIQTVPKNGNGEWLEAGVNWSRAVQARDLTSARVAYLTRKSPPPFEHGTSIILNGLRHQWDANSVEELARELWWLQPPFRSPSHESNTAKNEFRVYFESTEKELEKVFDKQMRAILRLWNARLVGKNKEGKVTLSLEFNGGDPQVYEYSIADLPHNSGRYDKNINLNDGTFEIRVFSLRHRQPYGILVEEARQYLFKYGGVHVYDGGFRLPYYGVSENDWLRIEFDHAHRRFVSELLPEEFQAQYAQTQRLRFLPSVGRLFGVVNVNTSREPNLKIMITRDRLADSIAFQDLTATIRYALDLYAFEEARRQYQIKEAKREIEPAASKLERVEQVLEYYESEIPQPIYTELREKVQEATAAAVTNQERVLEQMELLGPLATAGISALAYQHELRKQFSFIEDIIQRMEQFQIDDEKLRLSLKALSKDLLSWVKRAKATNALFDYLADAENTKTRQRFLAAKVIRDIQQQTRFLARGIEVDTSHLDKDLLLPEASLAEWGAIFQNVFTNAYTAMLDSEDRLLHISSESNGRYRQIFVQDTGYGVDLKNADKLFEPFERKSKISRERQALGYGGMGLGLTIVRLLANRIGCEVGFVEPSEGFSSAFSLSWREVK